MWASSGPEAAGRRRWNVELDGEVVGTVENGSASLLEARPGRHSLRVFYEWYSSRPLELELRAGEELVFGCRQQSNPLLSLFAPKRSLVLERLLDVPRARVPAGRGPR